MSANVRKPVLPLAWLSLIAALIAAVFALYGSFLSEIHLPNSPLNVARGGSGLIGGNTALIAFAAYFLPFGLGVIAAFAGGRAMRMIEERGRVQAGSRHSVFAIMIGGLAAVVSGSMILAVYGWSHIPAIYSN
jgi:hypothetical protein